MINLLKDLYGHLWWADARLLAAAMASEKALADESVRTVLHHIVVVEHFFFTLIRGEAFDAAAAAAPPANIADLIPTFQREHQRQQACLDSLSEDQFSRVLESPYFRDFKPPTVQIAITQVALHSQNHRGQCLTRLRELGEKPPTLDYILWCRERPAADWTFATSASAKPAV